MPTVQVDLSEYDMLRENKKKAEEEVKDLKETIKGLKDKSRVVLQTKFKYHSIDTYRIASAIKHSMNYNLSLSVECIASIINTNLATVSALSGEYDSCQYIGFDDVKFRVEEHYKKEIDKAITDYEDSKRDYYRLKDSVEERIKKEYSNMLDKLEKEKKNLIEKHEEDIKSKDEEIKVLQERLTELSKSKEDRIAELTAIIEKAKAEMIELTKVKKGFFNKIFK